MPATGTSWMVRRRHSEIRERRGRGRPCVTSAAAFSQGRSSLTRARLLRETCRVTLEDRLSSFEGAWNADDLAERRRLIHLACAEDAVFVTHGAKSGLEEVLSGIGEFRKSFPAAIVTFATPDEHGGFARVAWKTAWNDGRTDLEGEDFIELAEDGRLRLIVSFDDPPAPDPER